MDNRISIRRGDSFDLPVVLDDDALDTARLIVKTSVDSVTAVIDLSAVFQDRTANLHADEITAEAGDYIGQIDVTYTDGAKISFPDPESCDDDVDFIQVEVKPSLSFSEVS